MEKIARRMFCGTAMMAFPLLRLHAGTGEDVPSLADAVIDILADQISGITADGAQNGFKAEHFRRYAGLVRTFDAYLEQKGTNRQFNDRLDDDDFYRVNPAFTAQITAHYWQKHAIHWLHHYAVVSAGNSSGFRRFGSKMPILHPYSGSNRDVNPYLLMV